MNDKMDGLFQCVLLGGMAGAVFIALAFIAPSCGTNNKHGGTVDLEVKGDAKIKHEAGIDFSHCFKTLNGRPVYETPELMRECVNKTLDIALSVGDLANRNNNNEGL